MRRRRAFEQSRYCGGYFRSFERLRLHYSEPTELMNLRFCVTFNEGNDCEISYLPFGLNDSMMTQHLDRCSSNVSSSALS